MEKFTPSNLKGIIDAEPAIQSMRNRIISTLRENFELSGFLPLETSILNHLDLLTHKYDESAEIVREIYKLRDQGERDIGLRFDLTVPFAKFIAMNRNMKMPFRRYEIGRVFRNGPVKSGRLREFYQCDIDVVGQGGIEVEAEIIALVVKCFIALGIEPVVKIGNRKLLSNLIQAQGVQDKDMDNVIGIIDKMEKVSRAELVKDLEKYVSTEKANALLDSFANQKPDGEIASLFARLKDYEVDKHCVFAPSLARGLNYYTGVIFEVFDKAGRISSSLGGGGRYDNMITDFIDNGLSYPALGVSFGLEPIMAVLQSSVSDPLVDVLIIPIETHKLSFDLAENLRKKGCRVLVLPQKVTKAMEYANAVGIPFVTVVGEREGRTKLIEIKRMSDGEKQVFSVTTPVKIAKFVQM